MKTATMSHTPTAAVMPYWNSIKDTTPEIKAELMDLIRFSMKQAKASEKEKEKKKEKKGDFDEFLGIWNDIDMTSEELIELCTSGRKSTRPIPFVDY